MKRKAIIGVIASTVLIGATVGGVTISKNIVTNKTNAISEISDDDNLEKDNEKVEDDNDLGENQNSINEINEKDKNNESINVEENKEQTLLEGYEIFYKARDIYNAGEYEEALRLYNTITNKEALAKIEFFKEELDYYIGLYDFINEAKELYESGKYELARVVLYNVTGSKQSNKQTEITNNLLSKIEEKINENGKKEFTTDLAVEYLKMAMGDNEDNIYEPYPVEILDDGSKSCLIEVRDKKNPTIRKDVFAVNEYGRVTGD